MCQCPTVSIAADASTRKLFRLLSLPFETVSFNANYSLPEQLESGWATPLQVNINAVLTFCLILSRRYMTPNCRRFTVSVRQSTYDHATLFAPVIV